VSARRRILLRTGGGAQQEFYAHDEKNEAHVGDVVRIEETRPLSKLKRWKLKEHCCADGAGAGGCAGAGRKGKGSEPSPSSGAVPVSPEILRETKNVSLRVTKRNKSACSG